VDDAVLVGVVEGVAELDAKLDDLDPGQSSLTKAAQSLGVDSASIRSWIRKFDPAPLATAADAGPEELKREILRLKEENRRLLMEREILKKATAFFAREQS
jgi:transposase